MPILAWHLRELHNFCFRRLKSRWNVVLKRFMVKDQEIVDNVDTFSGQESWNSHAMHSALHKLKCNALIWCVWSYDQLFFNCSSKVKTFNFFHEKVWNGFQITDQQNSPKCKIKHKFLSITTFLSITFIAMIPCNVQWVESWRAVGLSWARARK